jgi:hypothetical protein
MKTIQRTAAALLIVAGSMIPAFAQGRGNGHGRDDDRGGRQQQRDNRGDDRRGGGQQYRQDQRQGNWQRQDQRQGNWQQQSYRQPQYRQQNNYRPQNNYRGGGSSFGYRSGGGMRWADRGGYRGRFIPQNRFYGSFGRQHFFRVGRPAYYNGYTQFSYGGYGFQMLDPVPAYWGQNWYDSDDVYVDYEDDGYYMYNRSYPGVGIAVNINF